MEQVIALENSYAGLPDRFYTKLKPKPVDDPSLIAVNDGLAHKLGISPEFLHSSDGLAALAGNGLFEGSQPLAMAYAGQQFGNWVPQLGDGRAVLLGEVLDQCGVRHDIQLKGSGPTPFSRMGDGRAWLGPVLREYIVSEAMFALGVPTTRALATVTTGEPVIREQVLPGAILTRTARSFVRVGTFQYFAARRDDEAVKALADFAIDRLYPDVRESENPYYNFLQAVINAQAQLVAKWMNIGFIHGVMNTDNVSIAGETIDYGPCAFMDEFKANRVFSSIDEMGRYAYSNQPRVTHWNLVQLAQSILPLLSDDADGAVELAQKAIDAYPAVYSTAYQSGFNAKLGLSEVQEGDDALGNELLSLMEESQADFTNTFQALTTQDDGELASQLPEQDKRELWLKKWRVRLRKDEVAREESRALMQQSNPVYIPRNHQIEQAIRSALEDDFDPFDRLNRVLSKPFDFQDGESDLMAAPQPKEAVLQTFCGT